MLLYLYSGWKSVPATKPSKNCQWLKNGNVLGLIQVLSKFINKTSTDLEKCRIGASVSFPGPISQHHIIES